MRTWLRPAWALARKFSLFGIAAAIASLLSGATTFAQSTEEAGGEASLKLPDLTSVQFLGIDGHKLLLFGILFCIFGLIFGLVIYSRLKNLPLHRSMRDISELIYETCKTYLITQGKFLIVLWLFIAVVIVLYFGVLAPVPGKSVAVTLPIILAFSLIGIAGSYGVAWFGIRVNTFANSRTAFASLRGKPYPIYHTPLEAGMSIGMMLISVELLMMLFILLFIPGDYAGPCFIGFAIGESLGAAALRIAGGIFTTIAGIGADLRRLQTDHSGNRWRYLAMVEAWHDYFLRNAGGRDHSGACEGVHVDRIAACERGCDFGGRRRRFVGNIVRIRRGKFLGLLHRAGDGAADVQGLLDQQHGARRNDAGSGRVRVRACGVRFPGHGAGDHRRRFLWTGDGQRAIGV